ncbi:MAG: c-type cytochrome [Planctomycetota bacterium]|nr:c-type cytochrome [Planctomycetota bacterium]MDA1177673.1 c-type cytochrome [Planctomycetota bacterium]
MSRVILCFQFVLTWQLCGDLTLASGGHATPSSSISVHAGFRVELLRSAQKGEGSWISMTFDPQGRIILGLDEIGLARITLGGKTLRQEQNPPTADKLDTPVGQLTQDPSNDAHFELLEHTQNLKHCRGVLAAHDGLYVCATDSNGFYRLDYDAVNDQFKQPRLVKSFDYRSRFGHGANQVVLGPDELIYVVVGNDVSFPDGSAPDSAYRDPRNDWVIPSPYDTDQDNRVGYIARTDREGTQWEIFAGGFRNQFDMAFSPDGEIFTYDADMEWDVGQPWYRPTRINHVVSAGEYGWRWGTGKWPAYYADSLPSNLDLGLGSPTGMVFGTHCQFPAPYRKALFAADWQNGRILLVHTLADGASYRCEYEVFLEGAPLNVCDMAIGPDGALYFITGGRGSQSGLYRVITTGEPTPLESTTTPTNQEKEERATAARRLRHQLEEFHKGADPRAVDFAWDHLNSPDVWIRFAARIAIERQPTSEWREKALKENRPQAALMGLMALARVGAPTDLASILQSMDRLKLHSLDPSLQLIAMRVLELTFIRQGQPNEAQSRQVREYLEAMYPRDDSRVNRELCDLLVYLDSPKVVAESVALLGTSISQEEQIHYGDVLSRANRYWTPQTRRDMLAWLAQTSRFRGGKWLSRTLDRIRSDFLAQLTAEQQDAFKALIVAIEDESPKEAITTPRPFVKQWTMTELLPAVADALPSASEDRGKGLVAATTCLRCHLIGNQGTPVGPDLSTVGKRYDSRAILESILEPSRQIDPKYRSASYELDSGRTVTGRVVSVTGTEIVLEINSGTGETETVGRDSIVNSYPASVSPMPENLLDTFTEHEIADIIAYLRMDHRQP